MSPNLSLKGEESIPTLVVAPTKVNLFIGNVRVFANVPEPVMKSTLKSSMAE